MTAIRGTCGNGGHSKSIALMGGSLASCSHDRNGVGCVCHLSNQSSGHGLVSESIAKEFMV